MFRILIVPPLPLSVFWKLLTVAMARDPVAHGTSLPG